MGEQIKAAAAQVDTAKAHYQGQEAQVEYSRIISPIAGIIADRPLYPGEMASPGAPLLTVVNISRLVARINVATTDVAAVKVGQQVVLTQGDKHEQIEGKVTVVSP